MLKKGQVQLRVGRELHLARRSDKFIQILFSQGRQQVVGCAWQTLSGEDETLTTFISRMILGGNLGYTFDLVQRQNIQC